MSEHVRGKDGECVGLCDLSRCHDCANASIDAAREMMWAAMGIDDASLAEYRQRLRTAKAGSITCGR